VSSCEYFPLEPAERSRLAGIVMTACGGKPELTIGPREREVRQHRPTEATLPEMGNLFDFEGGSSLDGGGLGERASRLWRGWMRPRVWSANTVFASHLGTCAKNDDVRATRIATRT